ncbi:uncharacterized protein IWZ02DRAFT_70496 [Phyllosticta citriasiana]|uniref:uncharacterized protein n=1 Tax=Phyllosticta citriasiana TaxID=595635 RepID=UPI0030FD8DE9
MSFINKLTNKFEGMMKDKDEGSQSRGYDGGYGAPPPQQYGGGYGQPQYSQPPQHYQSPPPDQGYGRPPPPPPPPPEQYRASPGGSGYGYPPPGPDYRSPPPPASGYAPPPSGYAPPGPPPPPSHDPPPLAYGWYSHWDSTRNRAYYAEPATGRVQWEQPPFGAPAERGPPGGEFYNQYGGAMPPVGYGQGSGYDGPHGQRAEQYYGDVEKKENKEGHSTGAMVGAAAAGVVGGAALGALVSKSCPAVFLNLNVLDTRS